jgi:hypothetical protein
MNGWTDGEDKYMAIYRGEEGTTFSVQRLDLDDDGLAEFVVTRIAPEHRGDAERPGEQVWEVRKFESPLGAVTWFEGKWRAWLVNDNGSDWRLVGVSAELSAVVALLASARAGAADVAAAEVANVVVNMGRQD